MKVTVIGSHLCPDTLYALNKLVEAKADITFQNLSASLPDLKAYLALRESSPVFEGPKAKGSLGIPCFVREDGTVTLSWSRCSTEWMRVAANKPSPQKNLKGKIAERNRPGCLSRRIKRLFEPFKRLQNRSLSKTHFQQMLEGGPGGAAPLCVFTGRCGTDPPGTPGGLPHRTRCRPGA